MRRRSDVRARLIACALLAVVPRAAGVAQVQPADPTTDAPASAPLGTRSDPVIGSVDGKLIFLSDLTRVASTLPEQIRALPFDQIMPALLDRMIDHTALIISARRAGLDQRPDVRRDMRAAADLVLERALLAQITPTKVTDAAIQARFTRQYANRPPAEEVRARHILVGTEVEAKSVLDELKGGADFATLARVVSKDSDAKQGGDLGFFRRDQVWPGFADTAFSLQPGQVSQVPIHNEFGWHIVKVEERRLVAPPTLSDVREQIRQDLTAEAVQAAVADARSDMIIHRFNLDGSEIDSRPSGRGGTGRSR
jgi:peptidyl-prolyl cis-trans isomerase C